jgi:hypothetical protein
LRILVHRLGKEVVLEPRPIDQGLLKEAKRALHLSASDIKRARKPGMRKVKLSGTHRGPDIRRSLDWPAAPHHPCIGKWKIERSRVGMFRQSWSSPGKGRRNMASGQSSRSGQPAQYVIDFEASGAAETSALRRTSR